MICPYEAQTLPSNELPVPESYDVEAMNTTTGYLNFFFLLLFFALKSVNTRQKKWKNIEKVHWLSGNWSAGSDQTASALPLRHRPDNNTTSRVRWPSTHKKTIIFTSLMARGSRVSGRPVNNHKSPTSSSTRSLLANISTISFNRKVSLGQRARAVT